MTKWNEWTADQITALKTAVASQCMRAAGLTDATKQTAIANLFADALDAYVKTDCRGFYDPGDAATGTEFDGAVTSIVMAGRPFLPTIAAIIRSSASGASTIAEYGRTVSSGATSKSGTENVSIDATGGADKLAVQVPDMRVNTESNTDTTDVDAGEKFRFYDDMRRVLLLQLDAWVRRVTFPWDL